MGLLRSTSRMCLQPGCRTILSRYNRADFCFAHDHADITGAARVEVSEKADAIASAMYGTCLDCRNTVARKHLRSGLCRACRVVVTLSEMKAQR